MRESLRLFCATALLISTTARADVILQMTTIGNAGNAPDHPYPIPETAVGQVNHDYQISTYEVTVAQYTEFLNAAAASDPNGLWSTSMGDGGGLGIVTITRSGEDGSYTYTAAAGTENQPVRFVSFYDACRFSNWLANGQGSGSTETGSYRLADGYSLGRAANATWVIPTEDEWYKAAYYNPETGTYSKYPNGSDTASEPTDTTTPREMNFGDSPYWHGWGVCYTAVGETTGRSSYGVADMGGNVQEWTETFEPSNYRITRGGEFMDGASALSTTAQQPYDPSTEGDLQGFRVAYIIPEPSSLMLVLLGSLGCAWGWRRRTRTRNSKLG